MRERLLFKEKSRTKNRIEREMQKKEKQKTVLYLYFIWAQLSTLFNFAQFKLLRVTIIK